jgi:hypothetical protein
MMITETTITQFEGWDPNAKPEFMRSRKALQYANNIDDYVRIIKEGNNGEYANDWAHRRPQDERDCVSRVRVEEYAAMAHERRILRQLEFCPRSEVDSGRNQRLRPQRCLFVA